jgi:hypothetical protein
MASDVAHQSHLPSTASALRQPEVLHLPDGTQCTVTLILDRRVYTSLNPYRASEEEHVFAATGYLEKPTRERANNPLQSSVNDRVVVAIRIYMPGHDRWRSCQIFKDVKTLQRAKVIHGPKIVPRVLYTATRRIQSLKIQGLLRVMGDFYAPMVHFLVLSGQLEKDSFDDGWMIRSLTSAGSWRRGRTMLRGPWNVPEHMPFCTQASTEVDAPSSSPARKGHVSRGSPVLRRRRRLFTASTAVEHSDIEGNAASSPNLEPNPSEWHVDDESCASSVPSDDFSSGCYDSTTDIPPPSSEVEAGIDQAKVISLEKLSCPAKLVRKAETPGMTPLHVAVATLTVSLTDEVINTHLPVAVRTAKLISQHKP